jgi:quercetin 2,3-dioxygenase
MRSETKMEKQVLGGFGNDRGHWVGDGFPVRSLFSYDRFGEHISPFLLLDYAGPHRFEPTNARRGVGEHPHRGFETVTIVYEGEVEHRDSAGHGGIIGPGDVQWMTAAGGIVHEEYHAPSFARSGGPFRMIQLWVNLPAKDKMAPAGYQGIVAADIPTVPLAGGNAPVRIVAGELNGVRGPAKTFTPVNVWDMKIAAGAEVSLPLPDGHTTMLIGLGGNVVVAGAHELREAKGMLLSLEGDSATIRAKDDAMLLVLTGTPLGEPIVGYGPFVMNSEAEIRQAIDDFNSGRFVQPAA